ncbi:MAG: hypothetical protein R2788_08670 [Saprospiraceae bacterium]
MGWLFVYRSFRFRNGLFGQTKQNNLEVMVRSQLSTRGIGKRPGYLIQKLEETEYYGPLFEDALEHQL